MKIIFLSALFVAVPLTTPVFAEDREPSRGDNEKRELAERKSDELRKAGKQDEAKRVEHWLREGGEKHGDVPRKDGVLDEQQRQHVSEAVEHLHAAGLHEPADRIEQMLRGLGTKEEHAAREHRGSAAPTGPEAAGLREAHEQMQRAMHDMQEQTQRALRETHEQMAKMARAIEELREQTARPRGDGERRKE